MQLEDVSVGAEYDGKVTSVREYGAFVSFGANADGLVHISQIADSFVEDIRCVVPMSVRARACARSLAVAPCVFSAPVALADAMPGHSQRGGEGGSGGARTRAER